MSTLDETWSNTVKFRTFIRLELLGVFWIMAVIYSSVSKCSGLCCQLAVCCLFWVSKFKYCWCICQQHREKNFVLLQKSQCVIVTQCTSVSVVLFSNKVCVYLKHKIIWKCRKGREVTEISWSVCLSQVTSVKLFSPVSQSPSCSGDFIVSPVTLQCLAIVLLESKPVLIYLSHSEQGEQIKGCQMKRCVVLAS